MQERGSVGGGARAAIGGNLVVGGARAAKATATPGGSPRRESGGKRKVGTPKVPSLDERAGKTQF